MVIFMHSGIIDVIIIVVLGDVVFWSFWWGFCKNWVHVVTFDFLRWRRFLKKGKKKWKKKEEKRKKKERKRRNRITRKRGEMISKVTFSFQAPYVILHFDGKKNGLLPIRSSRLIEDLVKLDLKSSRIYYWVFLPYL